jgi:hypothetical protein
LPKNHPEPGVSKAKPGNKPGNNFSFPEVKTAVLIGRLPINSIPDQGVEVKNHGASVHKICAQCCGQDRGTPLHAAPAVDLHVLLKEWANAGR